jgi:hypothetical protein
MEISGELEARVQAWREAPKKDKWQAETEIQRCGPKVLNEMAMGAVEASTLDEDGLPRMLEFSEDEKLFINYGFFSHLVKNAEGLPQRAETEAVVQRNEACKECGFLYVTDLLNVIDSANIDRRLVTELEDKIRAKEKEADVEAVEIERLCDKKIYNTIIQLPPDAREDIKGRVKAIRKGLLELCADLYQLGADTEVNGQIRGEFQDKEDKIRELSQIVRSYQMKNPEHLGSEQKRLLILQIEEILAHAKAYGALKKEQAAKERDRTEIRRKVRANAHGRARLLSASIVKDLDVEAEKRTQGFFRELSKARPMMAALPPYILTAEDVRDALGVIDKKDPLLFQDSKTKKIARPKIVLVPGVGDGQYIRDLDLNLIRIPMSCERKEDALKRVARAMADYRIERTVVFSADRRSGRKVSACLESFAEDKYWKSDGKTVPGAPDPEDSWKGRDKFKEAYQKYACGGNLDTRMSAFFRDVILPDPNYVSLPIEFRGMKPAEVEQRLAELDERDRRVQYDATADNSEEDYAKACLKFMKGVPKKNIADPHALRRACVLFKRVAEEDKKREESQRSAMVHYSYAIASMRMAEVSDDWREKREYIREALDAFDEFRTMDNSGIYYAAASKFTRELLGKMK